MFQKRRGKSSRGGGWGGKKGRRRTAHGKHGEMAGAASSAHTGPRARPQHGFPWGPPQNHRQHPHGKAGHNWDRPPSASGLRFLSSFFFFFFSLSLKAPHLSSFRRRAPAGVFVLEGCWVIDLLALLFPLAGVSQVGAVNSSEPRARGAVPVGRAD